MTTIYSSGNHITTSWKHPTARSALPSVSDQGLCVGAVFSITATNGIDARRRMRTIGFCQSVEFLSETVEYTVTRRGGEVWKKEYELKSGVHESLTMTLALPALWGVPPAHESLMYGIESGGGIIDSIIREWLILPN